jgi:uncharacterized protein with PQ loop repeat
MPTVEFLAVLSASWGLLMATSPLLQIRRILERRSSDDLSVPPMVVFLIGSAIWFTYGNSIGNVAIMIPNGVAVLVWLGTMLVTLRFRSRAA